LLELLSNDHIQFNVKMRNIVDTNASPGAPHQPSFLPVNNATVPYWRSELHEIDEYRSTKDLPTKCDIAIIGAGLAGVSTAYHLSKQYEGKEKPSIVLLEARQVCSGATGRNGVSLPSSASYKNEVLRTSVGPCEM
jgi:hypothetical protein